MLSGRDCCAVSDHGFGQSNHIIGTSKGHLECAVFIFPEDHIQFLARELRQSAFDESSGYSVQQGWVSNFIKGPSTHAILKQKSDQNRLLRTETNKPFIACILSPLGLAVDGALADVLVAHPCLDDQAAAGRHRADEQARNLSTNPAAQHLVMWQQPGRDRPGLFRPTARG